jgi:hypothetical protein
MSTTVIDALLVTLGLDATQFTKGVDASTKAQAKLTAGAAAGAKDVEQLEKKLAAAQVTRAKEMEARAKSVAEGFKKIRNEALGLLALFTAGMGLKSFAENTINTAAGLDRMSANLGMSAKDLSMWQLAAKHAGGTAEGMTGQLKAAASDIAQFKMGLGVSSGLQASFRYGVTANDLTDSNTLLMKQADILKGMYDIDPTKAMEAAKLMGISEDSFQLLKNGSAAVMKQRQAQAALADEMARAAKPAEELRKKFDDLKNQVEAIGVKILLTLLPRFDQLVTWIETHKEDITNWVDGAVKGFSEFVERLDKAADSVGGWKTVLIALLALKVLSFATDMLVLAAAIGKVGAGLGVIAGSAGLLKLLGGLGLLAYSGDLNKGEGDELKRRRAGMPGFDADGNPSGATPAGAAPTAPARSGGTRGMRNNNPGNIEFGAFAKKHGASSSDGRFAIFPTMEAGQAAQRALLGGYLSSGANTVSKAISKWAPSSENNTAAYVAAVAKQMGVGPDQALNSSHIPALADAISRHENGSAWDKRNAMAAVNMSANAGRGSNPGAGGNTNTSTTDVKIGSITVQTQATDAAGIAKDIGGAVGSYSFVAQANTGMN